MKRYLFLLTFFSFMALTGCGGWEWVTSKPFPHSFDTVWNTTYKVLEARYDILHASKDPEKKEIETEWKIQPSIHYLEGIRNKVYARVEEYQKPAEGEDETAELPEEGAEPNPLENQKRYVVKICVRKEQNRDVENPAIWNSSSWFSLGNNMEEARILVGFIQSNLMRKYTPQTEEIKPKTDEKKEEEIRPETEENE